MPIKQRMWKIEAKPQSLMQFQQDIEQELEIAIGAL